MSLENLITICHANLKNSPECLEYLANRNISKKSIDKYQIGFFPQNLDTLLKYIDYQFLREQGILNIYGNSKFKDTFSLIFPIFDDYGTPIALSGRTLMSDNDREILGIAKYENTKYEKSNYLYGLNHSRGGILRRKFAIICEGYFDHIALDANQITNSVAICGTAFSKNHLLKLRRYTKSILFLLDNDQAGQTASMNIHRKYHKYDIELIFAKIPSTFKDVDEFFRENQTREAFFNSLEFINMKELTADDQIQIISAQTCGDFL